MGPALPADGGANFLHPVTPRDEHGRPFDFFCCGHAFLPDGNLLVAGGTLDYDRDGHGFLGLADALVFDVAAQRWSVRADMGRGRWYPTLTTLGDGQVLATSGPACGSGDSTGEVATRAPVHRNLPAARGFADRVQSIRAPRAAPTLGQAAGL